MLTGGVSNQVGAGLGAQGFDALGPAGVVAIRQLVAAVVLLPVARPPLRRMTWAQWWPTLCLAVVFSCMNLSLYAAVERIGLGLAVTLEFLGPLAVALAGSRSRRDLLAAVAAGVGVYVLVSPGPTSDFLGIGLGLAAAVCWAAYIQTNRLVGSRLPGLQAPALAAAVSTILYLPVILALLPTGHLTGAPVAAAAAAGLLSSVVPYAVDLVALRSVPPRSFGVFMSVHPVLAAVTGLLLLHQSLGVQQWVGIGVIVLTNALTVLTRDRPETGSRQGRSRGRKIDHEVPRGAA